MLWSSLCKISDIVSWVTKCEMEGICLSYFASTGAVSYRVSIRLLEREDTKVHQFTFKANIPCGTWGKVVPLTILPLGNEVIYLNQET